MALNNEDLTGVQASREDMAAAREEAENYKKGITPQQETPQAQPQEQPQAERPDYIPEKFWTGNLEESVKKMSESYSQLEKGKTQESQQQQEQQIPNNITPETPITEETQLDTVIYKLSAEYHAGGMTQETIEEAVKRGVPAAYIEKYKQAYEAQQNPQQTQGQDEAQQLLDAKIYAEAGGQESYNKLLDWADANLEAAQLEAYNNMLDSGNDTQIKLALDDLKGKFGAATGVDPKNLSGDTVTFEGDIYKSEKAAIKDMQSKEYKQNIDGFRDKVDAKIERSPVFDNYLVKGQ